MKMVAGERLSFDSRQENEEIISLGVWRINMLKSMKKYVDEIRADLKRNEAKEATHFDANCSSSPGDRMRGDP